MHRSGLRELARRNAILAGAAIVLFFGIGFTTDQPTGWGAAYVFGETVEVDLPSSCRVETIIRKGSAGRSMGTCQGTTWTAQGRSRSGTLHAYASDIDRSSSTGLRFTGTARALGDHAYGRPETWMIILHLTALAAAAIGALGLLGCGAAALLTGRRATRSGAPAVSHQRVFAAEMGVVAVAAVVLGVSSPWL